MDTRAEKAKLKRALKEARELQAKLRKALGNDLLSEEDQVEIGTLLFLLGKIAGEAVDPLKVSLRSLAVAQAKGASGPQCLEADSASCVVTIPKPKPQLQADLSIADLRTRLGPEFDTFFQVKETLSLQRNFQEKVADSTPDVAVNVLSTIQLVEDTPLVTFKSKV